MSKWEGPGSMPNNKNNKEAVVFGITGGSGVGKSYVTRLFMDYNAYIIDADKVGHQVLADKTKEVVAVFGESILSAQDNTVIDRKKLGALVFSDKKNLKHLNKIVHPYIVQEIFARVLDNKKYYDIIVIDAALLFDLKINIICDLTILVHADEEIKIKRIMERDKIEEIRARDRINSQRDFLELEPLVDIVVMNNNSE